ncbi:MAG TPA: class I SAM-dependent methyltransferase [Streptosporangiaceae bacterium]
MPELDRDAAREWIRRWDLQQEDRLPDREERFTALIDAVEEGTGRKDPLVIDLGCGPGSLSARLLDRIPEATIAAVDADPVMLTLARAAFTDRPGLRFFSVDLRQPGWAGQLGLDRPVDAAVSTTALHWLPPEALTAVYAELAQVMRPGALLLNGDQLRVDEAASPVLARLNQALLDREDKRRFPSGHAESWSGWWDAVAADPALAGPVAEREAWRGHADHHGWATRLLDTHVEALRAANFAEVGTLWQRGENRLLCGVR